MDRKQWWEKEKLLVTSNFSLFRNVFRRLVLQTRKDQGLFGKGSRCFQVKAFACDKTIYGENDYICLQIECTSHTFWEKKMLPTKVFFLGPHCFQKVSALEFVNPLLHRYSFYHINNRQLLKTSWEKKKLLLTSNFFFSHDVFYSVRKLYPFLSIFLTSYLYLLLNVKSLILAYQVKG